MDNIFPGHVLKIHPCRPIGLGRSGQMDCRPVLPSTSPRDRSGGIMRAVHRRRPSLVGMLGILVMVFLVQALLASPVGTPTASASGRCQVGEGRSQRPGSTGRETAASSSLPSSSVRSATSTRAKAEAEGSARPQAEGAADTTSSTSTTSVAGSAASAPTTRQAASHAC